MCDSNSETPVSEGPEDPLYWPLKGRAKGRTKGQPGEEEHLMADEVARIEDAKRAKVEAEEAEEAKAKKDKCDKGQ